LNILQVYLHINNELYRSRFSKVRALQTDRQTDTQTDVTERITTSHSRVVVIKIIAYVNNNNYTHILEQTH